MEQRLALNLTEDIVFDLWAQGKKQVEVSYNEVSDPPGWFFGEITAYFHPPQDDSKPVEPSFKSNFLNPEIKVEPVDILELKETGEDRPDWLKRSVSLKEGVDLEKYFGSDLTEQKAQIRLTLTVTPEGRKPYESSVTYQICPTVELVVRQYDQESGSLLQEREYNGINLAPQEFLADAKDFLDLAVYYRRTDWPSDSTRNVSFGKIDKLDLRGSNSLEYQLGVKDEAFWQMEGVDGLWETYVSSKKPLLATAARQSTGLQLYAEGQLSNAPAHYRYKSKDLDLSIRGHNLDQALKPLYLHIGLWVVPGSERGTSLAGAVGFVQCQNGKLQLPGEKIPLELSTVVKMPDVVVDDLGFLTEDGGLENLSLTSEPLSSLVSLGSLHPSIALPDWLSVWKLRYRGLRWSNISKGQFVVCCRIQGAEECVAFRINVRENMAEMVADLDANSEALDLTNKEWQKYSLTGTLGMFLARRECRGFLYNARKDIVDVYCALKGIPVPEEYEHYVCGAYSLRLARYMVRRRNGTANPKTALKMNGIEACQYRHSGLHDWFGFHLSGTKPDKEPIFIDPWWTQEWNIEEVKDNYGFKMQAARLTAVLTLLVTYAILLGYFMVWFIRAGLAGVGKIFPLELSLAEIRMILNELLKRWGWQMAIILNDLANWILQSPRGDPTLFDDDLNYARYTGIDLFTNYRDDLLQITPVPGQKVETWPKA